MDAVRICLNNPGDVMRYLEAKDMSVLDRHYTAVFEKKGANVLRLVVFSMSPLMALVCNTSEAELSTFRDWAKSKAPGLLVFQGHVEIFDCGRWRFEEVSDTKRCQTPTT